jgi:putative oxidoreductase
MDANSLRRLLLAGPRDGRPATAALVVRVLAGLVFISFGVGKFSHHADEVASFIEYGLPSPDAFVYAIGVLELAGGLMLVLGLGTRVAAFLLACDMVGAIAVSGIPLGEWVSLTVAPVELVACLYVLRVGPGRRALDPEP